MALAVNAAHPLLLACVRGEPLMPAAPIDWPLLLDEARNHGLLTPLHESLIASGFAVPDFFREAAIAQWASAHLLAAGLESTLDILTDMDVMPLKGPVLAEALYGDVALRPSNDLDLLVRKEDFSRAESILFNNGFAASEIDDYHRPFQRNGLVVELHRDLTSPRRFRFNVDDVWSRSHSSTFRHRAIRVMAPDDQALYLCLHGLKHGFASIIWIADVARALKQVVPESLFQLAQQQKLQHALFLSCEVVHSTFGLPPAVAAYTERYPKQMRAARSAAAHLLEEVNTDIEGTEVWSFYLQIETGARQRWYRRLSFFISTVEDRRWAETHGVPRMLAPVIRPFRLLKKHGLVRAWKIFFPK